MKAQKSIYSIIARRYLQSRKTLLASCVVAVIITCVLLVNLFTAVFAMRDGYRDSLFKSYGTRAHGLYRNFSQEAVDFVQQDSAVQEVEYELIVGDIDNPDLRNKPFESLMRYFNASMFHTSLPEGLLAGRLPEAYNEVVVSTALLDALGIPHTIGVAVPLSFTISSQSMAQEKRQEHFTLVGYYTSNKYFQNTEVVFVSEAYITPFSTLDSHFAIYFKSDQNLTQQTEDLLNRIPNKYANSRGSANSGYTAGTFEGVDLSIMIVVTFLLLFIGITAYLIINNLFTIFVHYDVHLYGQLKCLGASQKQIKKVIRIQLIYIAVIGIPIGLVAGYLSGKLLVPLMGELYTGMASFSFNPWIYLGTALFAFLALVISTRKPSVFCKSISPALLASHTTYEGKRRISYKDKHKITLWNMARIECLRNKGRLIKIVLSLATTPILLLAILTVVGSLDTTKYVKKLIVSDFIVAKHAYYQQGLLNDYDYTLDSSVIQELEDNIASTDIAKNYMTPSSPTSIESVTGNTLLVTPNSFQTTYQDKKFAVGLYGLGDFAISNYTILEGEIDIEKFYSGNYLLESTTSTEDRQIDPIFGVGEQVDLYFGETFIGQYEIMAVVMHNNAFEIRRGLTPYSKNFVLPISIYQSIKPALQRPYSIIFNVAEDDHKTTQRYVENFVLKYPDIYVQTAEELAKEWENENNTMLAIGIFLTGLIALIGLINMVGVVIVSIYSRREQFMNLRKIGMTKKQLVRLLFCESSLYAAITFAIFIVLGGAVASGLLRNLFKEMEFMTFHINMVPSLLIFIGYIISMVVVSWLTLQNLIKEQHKEN